LVSEDGLSKSHFSKRIIIYSIIVIIAISAISIALFRSSSSNNNGSSVNTLQDSTRKASIDKFETLFCGLDTNTNSNEFITEYKLPRGCEMPLGIAVDKNQVWYISTKNGTLGTYNAEQNSFSKEATVPIWKSRTNPIDFSQVWAVKVDGAGNVWFTDEKQNAIWRYNKSSQTFDIFKIPATSGVFGTTYPVSIDFDSKGNVFFVGIRSTSLWFGDITKMRNGTSIGISGIPIPVDKFSGIDPTLISTGSAVVDNKRNVVWVSMLAFQKKGQIVRYDIGTKTFKVFDMPKELTSPVGTAVDDLGNLWVTDHGTSMFYKFDSSSANITKFVTSKASPRIFGNKNDTSPAGAYTLPYWIKKSADGSLWFNEHTGNKIAKFEPANSTLIEYWIPTQNKLFGLCQQQDRNNETCGIANALQFSPRQDGKTAWFTEWTENKLGRVNAEKGLPFFVSTALNQLTLHRGESREIKLNVEASPSSSPNSKINMVASGTFTPTGDLGNSTGSFSVASFPINMAGNNPKQVSFIFTPSLDLKPGQYTLMVGAENEVISYLKAIKINII
jgi:virginiamycin B lyase